MQMQNQKQEYTDTEFPSADIKLIILGDSAVGKSKMVERFLLNDYEERQLSTYALTMYRHVADMDGKKYQVGNIDSSNLKDVWDTAGQDCFATIHNSYYFGANVAILAFDITRKLTYQHLKTWYSEMREHCPNIPCICVANKIDVDRSVTSKSFKFAEQNNMPFYFVSAADGTNIVKVFNEALKLGLENKLNPQDDFMKDVMEILDDDTLFND